MKQEKLSQKLAESGLMLALATILSVVAIAKLPYGGSITFASMLPLIIVAYRYGFGWGLLAGATYGIIQMLLGLDAVSYATSAVAAIAIIMLDYVLAFATTSLSGLFNKRENQAASLTYAALLVCVMRYVFHVISGATVWAGLSIPTADALIYSLIYNATYMLPETIITCVAAIYLGSTLNFRTPSLSMMKKSDTPKAVVAMTAVSGLLMLISAAAIVAMVFTKLQNPETGEFDITGISNVNLPVVGTIFGVALVAVLVMYFVSKSILKKQAR